MPFLIVKRAEAELALEFWREFSQVKRAYAKRPRPPVIIARFSDYHTRLKALRVRPLVVNG